MILFFFLSREKKADAIAGDAGEVVDDIHALSSSSSRILFSTFAVNSLPSPKNPSPPFILVHSGDIWESGGLPLLIFHHPLLRGVRQPIFVSE